MQRPAIVLLLAAGLVACNHPVPAEKSAYVGVWRAPQMSLSISQAGRVDYHRSSDGASKSVSGPLQEFEGDNFNVGFGLVSTTFVVSVPPHSDGGVVRMTVDGVELTKASY